MRETVTEGDETVTGEMKKQGGRSVEGQREDGVMGQREDGVEGQGGEVWWDREAKCGETEVVVVWRDKEGTWCGGTGRDRELVVVWWDTREPKSQRE
ncbi:hypothetical protein Pmani_024176 [Petrolisthes manimaculis]|uniref:Uncharacterized protein n=1 Tax=Petrolisthes manimaculis TaxID=1843537 RepID=A0AAE1U2L7_9EUCA|nr:hypothetical protein Pmani_024176 [Petrolisthes manimaculis]